MRWTKRETVVATALSGVLVLGATVPAIAQSDEATERTGEREQRTSAFAARLAEEPGGRGPGGWGDRGDATAEDGDDVTP